MASLNSVVFYFPFDNSCSTVVTAAEHWCLYLLRRTRPEKALSIPWSRLIDMGGKSTIKYKQTTEYIRSHAHVYIYAYSRPSPPSLFWTGSCRPPFTAHSSSLIYGNKEMYLALTNYWKEYRRVVQNSSNSNPVGVHNSEYKHDELQLEFLRLLFRFWFAWE